MADQSSQRRRFPRYRAGLDAIIYLGSKTTQTRIVEISRGGCLVFPPLLPQPSPELKLSFRLAEAVPPVNCKGEIVYTISDKGTGIAFTEISLYNQDRITEFFEKQLAAEKAPGS